METYCKEQTKQYQQLEPFWRPRISLRFHIIIHPIGELFSQIAPGPSV